MLYTRIVVSLNECENVQSVTTKHQAELQTEHTVLDSGLC